MRLALKKLEQPDFTASARLGASPTVSDSERDVPSYGYPSLARQERANNW